METSVSPWEWAAWVDDRFVHVLTPNIYRTWGEVGAGLYLSALN